MEVSIFGSRCHRVFSVREELYMFFNSQVVYMLSLYKLLKVYEYCIYNISDGYFRVTVLRLGPT